MTHARLLTLAAALSLLAAHAPAAPVLPPLPGATQPAAAADTHPAPTVQVQWTTADHPSGLYHARDAGKVTVTIENRGDEPTDLGGQFAFGPTPGADEPFKPLTITPLVESTLAKGQRVRMEVPIRFAGVGDYELRLNGEPVRAPDGRTFRCIFPPRPADALAPAALPAQSHFSAPLPPGAAAPGVSADTIARTGVRRFNAEFHFPADTPAPPGALNTYPPQDLTAILQALAAAKAELFLTVHIPTTDPADREGPAMLHEQLKRLLAAAGATATSPGAIRALALAPRQPLDQVQPDRRLAHIASFRAHYLAAYEAAKKADKTILMLGTPSYAATETLLLSKDQQNADLAAFVDAYAAASLPDLLAARALTGASTAPAQRKDIHLLTPAMPPAAALAMGITTVPLPPHDRNATVQLLSSVALFEVVHPDHPPYIAVFQGNGYAIAAIAGPGAATPLDARYPQLAAAVPVPTDDKPAPTPELVVLDDTRDMRILDSAGTEVDCRTGDVLHIPLDRSVRYLLQGGSAEDLAALLRTARARHLPPLDIAQLGILPADRQSPVRMHLRLRSASQEETPGTVRLIAPGRTPAEDRTVGTRAFVGISPGKQLELTVPVEGPLEGPLVVELVTTGGRWRLAPARPR